MFKNYRKKISLSSYLLAMLLMVALSLESNGQANEIKFVEETLDNGLQVIYNIDRTAPMVATVLHYKVGSRDENPNLTGFAHFFEHLMFEATDDIPRESIDKYINEAGGRLNAHTSFDETVYKFEVPSNEIKLALWIESQRMRKLLVAEKGVETQRGVVKEEKNVRVKNQPYGTLLEKFAANVWKDGSYSWTPIGAAQHIDSAKIPEFRAFYDKFYQPNNGILVISGDFDINEVKDYVREYFGIYPKGKEIDREKFVMPELKEGYREEVIDEKAQLPAVFVGYRGPRLGEDDYYAMSLLTNILAAGESSRLYQRIVNNDQTAVAAQAMPFSLQYSGAVLLLGVAKPGKDIEDVEEAMYDEIEKLIEDGVTEEEFEKTKNINEVQFVSGKKNVLGKAMTLAQFKAYYDDANMINTEIEKYNKVTMEDLKRVAKKYLGTDKKVVLTYLPKDYEK